MSGDHPQEPALARCVCGGHGSISENRTRYGWQVLCKAPPRICGATTSHYEARAEAIAAWNRMQSASDASLYREALAQIIEWRHNPERVKMLCIVLLNGESGNEQG